MCLAGGTSVCQEQSFGEFVKLLADIFLYGKIPAAQNRTSVTRHEGWATEIGDCSLGRITVGIHPLNR